jgi:hypothetical protein
MQFRAQIAKVHKYINTAKVSHCLNTCKANFKNLYPKYQKLT